MSARRRGRSNGEPHSSQPGAGSLGSDDAPVPTASPRRSRRIAGQVAQAGRATEGNESVASPVSRRTAAAGAARQHPQTSNTSRKEIHMQAQASSPAATPTIQYSASFNPQPPKEIRPEQSLPKYVVRMDLTGSNLAGNVSPIGRGAVNAISRVVTPDGRDIMDAASNIPRSETATAPERHARLQDTTTWTFHFKPSSFHVSGFFRIRVSIIHTPMVDHGHGEIADSPVRLMTITSRVIHVHAFAPLV